MGLLEGKSRFIYLLSAQLREGSPVEDWNAWYDNVHVPDILTVPGFNSATRYAQRDAPLCFLAGYAIDGPHVDEPRYGEVTGWGEWAPYIARWSRGVFELDRTEFPGPLGGQHPVSSSPLAADRLS
ncbi:MAG: hypothetical protein WD810_06995 [Solirubrobacterales bacterium]